MRDSLDNYFKVWLILLSNTMTPTKFVVFINLFMVAIRLLEDLTFPWNLIPSTISVNLKHMQSILGYSWKWNR